MSDDVTDGLFASDRVHRRIVQQRRLSGREENVLFPFVFFLQKKIGHQRRQFSPPVSDETPVFHGAEGEIGYGHVVLFGQDVFHAKVRFEKVGDPRRHLQGEAVQ